MATVTVLDDRVGRKVRSALGFVRNPGTYLESDRGTYLVNTVHMARFHPLGVGVGDWQTHYPVYRKYKREMWFGEQFQVRRAHSDHVQMLGEGGWPGLFLWAAFLCSTMLITARRWILERDVRSLFLAAQLVAISAAMCVDYVIEHPYLKLQFFLVVFLCLSKEREGGAAAAASVTRSGYRRAVPLMITMVALVNVVYAANLGRKLVLSGHITRTYLQAVPSPLVEDPAV